MHLQIVKYYFKCPNCGSDEQFVKPSEDTYGLLISGGLPALQFADYQRRRVQCTKCTHLFRQPSIPNSPLASFAVLIIALMILSTLVACFAFALPDPSELLPSVPVIATIEKMIATQPRVAAYFFAVLFVLIVFTSWGAALLSNRAFRKRLSTEYCLKPLSAREFANINNTKPDFSKDTRDS